MEQWQFISFEKVFWVVQNLLGNYRAVTLMWKDDDSASTHTRVQMSRRRRYSFLELKSSRLWNLWRNCEIFLEWFNRRFVYSFLMIRSWMMTYHEFWFIRKLVISWRKEISNQRLLALLLVHAQYFNWDLSVQMIFMPSQFIIFKAPRCFTMLWCLMKWGKEEC
jgi:hypothetical protein